MSLLWIKEAERTAVGAGKEYLFDVGFWPGQGVDMKLIFVGLSGPLSPFDFIMAAFTGNFALFGNLGVRPLRLGFSAGTEGWDKFDTVFVESYGMTEMDDGIV